MPNGMKKTSQYIAVKFDRKGGVQLVFILFEGIDGCGKDTQIELLAKCLRKNSIPVLITREPGAKHCAGKELRDVVLNKDLTGLATLYLFLSDRTQHMTDVVKPFLLKNPNGIVLCNRGVYSSYAYQYVANKVYLDMPEKLFWQLQEQSMQDVKIDLTFCLDISYHEAQKRIANRKGIPSKFDKKDEAFFNECIRAYHQVWHPNLRMVDGEQDIMFVYEDIKQIVISIIEDKLAVYN